MARRDHFREFEEAMIDLTSCFGDDSDESALSKMLLFKHAENSFRECCKSDNLCKDDVPLPLTRIDVSEDYTVVWLHDGKPLDDHVRQDAERKLRLVFINTHFFTSIDTCLKFLYQLDADSVHLIFISSCFYDGRPFDSVSPLADPESKLAHRLRCFTYEYHLHGHASQWSSPNYVHSLTEEFIDIKSQHDAKRLLLNESSQIPYTIIWMRSSVNTQLESYLNSAFDSIEIYDDEKMCLDYIGLTHPSMITIYLILENKSISIDCPNIKVIYCIDSFENINRLVLQIRNDIRSDVTSPIRPIEKSARRLNNKYMPFVSLMSNSDLYLALYRHIDDRKKMKEEMIDACRFMYSNNQSELARIDEFGKKYSHEPDINTEKAIFWYTRDSFVYRLVNRALRTGDPDLIHPYRFFINDLYSELLCIHRQYIDPGEEDFIVYRGQGLTQPELIALQNSIGQLVTFTSFVSTTIDRELAINYAQCSSREHVVSALFEFHLNVTYGNTRPYAYIGPQSAIPDEYEVLISVGTIFQLRSIVFNEETGVWIIVVDLCKQNRHDVKHLRRTKSSHPRTKIVKFDSLSSVDEPTFHESLKSKLLSTSGNPKHIKTVSMDTVVDKKSERRNSLPLTLSEGQLTIRRMNWGKGPSDCLFLHNVSKESSLLLNPLQWLFQCTPVASSSMPNLTNNSLFRLLITNRRSLPNLSSIVLSAKQAKCIVRKLKLETNNCKSEQSLEEPLFKATVMGTVIFCIDRVYMTFTDSMSLKEDAQLMKRYLRRHFNNNQGRWCNEY